MRVVHVGAGFRKETTNGVNRAMSLHAEHQRRLGLEVAMVTFGKGPSRRATEPNTGIDLIDFAAPRSPFLLGRDASTFFATNAAGADLFHFHSAFVPRHNRAAALVDVPYVVTPHGAYSPRALRRSRLRKVIYRHLLDRKYLARASLVHGVTVEEEAAVRRYGPRGVRTAVVPNPVQAVVPVSEEERTAARSALGLSESETCLLFLGRLDVEHKGLDFLVDGFRLANAGRRLLLVGPPAGKRPVSDLLRGGDEGSIMLLGAAFGEEKRALFAAADAFAAPSRWDGLPTVVLEALAYGLPVLVTAATGLATFVRTQGAGWVIDPSPTAVGAAIGELRLRSREERERIANVALGTFGVTVVAPKLVDMYRDLLIERGESDR